MIPLDLPPQDTIAVVSPYETTEDKSKAVNYADFVSGSVAKISETDPEVKDLLFRMNAFIDRATRIQKSLRNLEGGINPNLKGDLEYELLEISSELIVLLQIAKDRLLKISNAECEEEILEKETTIEGIMNFIRDMDKLDEPLENLNKAAI